MVLKQKWVEGHHFWEGALRHFDKEYKVLVEKKMVEWRDKYFR